MLVRADIGSLTQPNTPRLARGSSTHTGARARRLQHYSTLGARRFRAGVGTQCTVQSASPARNTIVSANVDVSPQPKSTKTFVWERNWWPVLVVSYLDPGRPTPVELLGMQLVLWRDASGTWRCFRDSCPHRRVPLSEGRVEGGELVCSYHGWRFNQGGACTAIPQAPDAKSLAAATASPRSCVTSFPTQEAGGLLWVWADSGPTAAADAAAAQPPLPNALRQEVFRRQLEADWFYRQLPYDFDVLLENVADPSHVPYAHHGYSPLVDRHKAPPIPFHTLAGPLQQDSDSDLLPSGAAPACALQFASPKSFNNRIVFHPPGLVTIHTPQRLINVIYAVPSGPGRSVVITGNARAAPTGPKTIKARLLRTLMAAVPKWLQHVVLLRFFDGDAVFLNAQGRFLRSFEQQAGGQQEALSQGKRPWVDAYFMPMTCDRAVVAARKWMDSAAGGGPMYPADATPAAPEMTREQLLDRLGQHTKHCPDCRRGLQFGANMVAAGRALLAAAGFALCCLAGASGFRAMLSGGLPSLGTAAAVVVGLLAVRLQAAGEWLRQQLTFVDYVHADIP